MHEIMLGGLIPYKKAGQIVVSIKDEISRANSFAPDICAAIKCMQKRLQTYDQFLHLLGQGRHAQLPPYQIAQLNRYRKH